MRVLVQLALTFAMISLIAVGGINATIPEVHRRIVDVLGWMNDATFANLFAIAQAAPGPNVMIVSLIGWHVAGFPGLVVATLAMLIPSSLLAFAAGRLTNRLAGSHWIAVMKAGLVPVAIGLILASGLVMAQAAHRNWLTALITAGTAAFVFTTERNPLWALATGAALSLLGLWCGVVPWC